MGLAEHITARKSLFLLFRDLRVSLLADYCWETKRQEALSRTAEQNAERLTVLLVYGRMKYRFEM